MNDAAGKQLARLAEVLGGRVRLDACRDPVIEGRRNNIRADGTGRFIAVMMPTPRQWGDDK